MNILAIDIGNYSLKLVVLRTNRKNLEIVSASETILSEVEKDFPNCTNKHELQRELVAQAIHRNHHDFRVVFQLPNELLTHRFLDIPATSKKKAEQIIPFQLDDNLPYSVSQTHLGYKLIKITSGFLAMTNVIQNQYFKEYYSFFESKSAIPSVITSEISAIQYLVDDLKLLDECCILDLGHKTTKAYFVQSRMVVSSHTSFVAGESINEVISKTYQITLEEAVKYKHQNAFLLTDPQIENVPEDQKEFALLMKQIFTPLISDFKRWEIGHRVKFGHHITKIYLIGGTSNLTNLDKFIKYHTGISVENIGIFEGFLLDSSPTNKTFYLAKAMGKAIKSTGNVLNFLWGKYQSSSNAFISLYSASFIWIRSIIVAIILISGLMVEKYFFLKTKEKFIDTKVQTLLKTPALDISKKDQKLYLTKPEQLLTIFAKKNKSIKDEVTLITSSVKITGLKPLATLSKVVSNRTNIVLDSFISENDEAHAIFSSDSDENLNLLKIDLDKSNLLEINTKLNSVAHILDVHFSTREP